MATLASFIRKLSGKCESNSSVTCRDNCHIDVFVFPFPKLIPFSSSEWRGYLFLFWVNGDFDKLYLYHLKNFKNDFQINRSLHARFIASHFMKNVTSNRCRTSEHEWNGQVKKLQSHLLEILCLRKNTTTSSGFAKLVATRYVKREVGTTRENQCFNLVDLRFEMITCGITVNDVQKCQMFQVHYEFAKFFGWRKR